MAAVVDAVGFEAMANDFHAAVIAGRREFVDGAFKAIERISFSMHRYVEAVMIIITTGIAGGHGVFYLIVEFVD